MSKNGQKNSWRSEKALLDYIARLSRKLKEVRVVLFGSQATGENCRYSDYDLLVISDGLPSDFHKRIDLLWEEKPSFIDAIGLKVDEIKEMIHRTLILKALTQGVVLKGNINFLRTLAHRYMKKEGLIPTPIGFTHNRP